MAASSLGHAKSDTKNISTSNLDKIVAIVGGDVITQSELNKRMTMISRMSNEEGIKPSALRNQAMDSLINNLLQLQLGQRIGMQINETELNNVISNIAKNNHLTVEQLKKSLQEQEGLSFKEYREHLREQMLISRIQQQFLGKEVMINDKDVEKILRTPQKIGNPGVAAQYHATDILIAIPDDASPDQVKAATNVATQIALGLKKGVAIEKLVQKYNVTGQEVTNTDLGWRKTDELPNLFVKEVVKMGVGQVAGPIKAPNGLHLLKLLEVQGGQPQPIKLTKEQAQEIAFHQKLEERLKPWLKELREETYVKIID